MGLTFVHIACGSTSSLICCGLRPKVLVDFALGTFVSTPASTADLQLMSNTINYCALRTNGSLLTENFGFKNSVTSCLLEKCMSSGSVLSKRLSSSSLSFAFRLLRFLGFDGPGRVIPAPLVTGTNSSFAICFTSFSVGSRKSILNASFFSRRALG